MSNNQKYKNSRKYKCPYCDIKATRDELIDHVDKKHSELIPENYTSARVIYDFINGKDHGTCMICKKDVFEWNDKINRYYNLCKDPKCKAKLRERALANHIRVHNKPTLLNDPEHQKKMLENRKISGTYTFSDGGKHTYTGKYEKNALEFMDKVMNIPSKDIQSPGPILEYDFNGEKHYWITDIYYTPANLLIEVKDGGKNPNNRQMDEYRAKQVAKEVMVTDLGTFNYIRLTDNDFLQLLNIFAEMKSEALENSNPKASIHINEEVGGLPPHRPPEAYIIPYGMNNTFLGFAYSDSEMDKVVKSDDFGNITPIDEEVFKETYETGIYLYYSKDDIVSKISKIHESIIQNNMNILEILCDKKITKIDELAFVDCFKCYNIKRENMINKMIESAVSVGSDMGFNDSNVIKVIKNVKIHQSPKGYYASTYSKFYMSSEYFSDLQSLIASNIIDLMNDIYEKNSNGGDSDE